MRVLIALDVGPMSGEIVRAVAARPWPSNTTFLLLHVLDPFPFSKAPISLDRARQEAATQLKEAGKKLCSGGWAMKEEVVFGRARHELPKLADSWKADLIVVGSSAVGDLTRLLVGSTARNVLRHAHCSVEVVRIPSEKAGSLQKGSMKILVATDGSECSVAALKSVAARPWPTGSQFKVMSIPEPFMPLGQFPYFELKEIEELNTEALKDAKRYSDVGVKILQDAGLDAHPGNPLPRESDAREIVQEAERWHANLVVLGSHGRHGFERLTLGSVSEHVALHAPCSVEVIRGVQPRKRREKQTTRTRKKAFA